MVREVILDTNFFLLPYQKKIDIFKLLDLIIEEQHRYVTGSSVLKELQTIARNKGKTGAAAKLGLKVFELHKDEIEVIESSGFVDSWIMRYASANNAIVCTNDKQLKNKLKEKGIKVITTRGNDWVGFV
jgi:rRNA-processing protein FCF1